jgi:hypothetical protein
MGCLTRTFKKVFFIIVWVYITSFIVFGALFASLDYVDHHLI